MPFVPDWAPNVHPMIVHFPIALLFVGVLIDLIGLAFRERAFWRGAALIFYVGGGLGALAAVLSGNAVEKIEASELDELVVTDTIPLSDEAEDCERIRQLSIAQMLAETIRRIAIGESVSSMYVD